MTACRSASNLASKRWGEARLLAIAKALTEVTGPFQRPPGY